MNKENSKIIKYVAEYFDITMFCFILIFIIITSCQKKSEKKEVVADDFLTAPTYSESTDNDSYWFVVIETKTNGTKMNTFCKQNHPYFSVKELKKVFSNDVFILNIVSVDKETYEINNKDE